MTALLLAGCGGETERWENWQTRLNAAAEIAFCAEITANADAEATAYAAEVSMRGDGIDLTVTAPESISGVRFRCAAEGRAVSYEGVTLSLSPAREGELAPCRAAELLLRTLLTGYVLDTGRAGEYRTAQFQGPEGVTAAVWLTNEDEPVYAELARGEAVELTLRLSDWKIKEQE